MPSLSYMCDSCPTCRVLGALGLHVGLGLTCEQTYGKVTK